MSSCRQIQAREECLREATNIIDQLLTWALANRGTEEEFVICHTYRPNIGPPVINRAKKFLGEKSFLNMR